MTEEQFWSLLLHAERMTSRFIAKGDEKMVAFWSRLHFHLHETGAYYIRRRNNA